MVSSTNTALQYKFNGKQYEEELDLNTYDYGARNYDPWSVRWSTIDPLAEDMRRWSPYNFAFNNPLRFVDPDGMAPEDWVSKDGGKTYYWDSNITSEEQANKAGVKYGGKTTSEVIKKEDSPWIWNQFENTPGFNFKSYYESPVKEAYSKVVSRYNSAIKERKEKLDVLRENKDTAGYDSLNENPIEFEPVDLSFASQFPLESQFTSFRMDIEHNGESYNILVRVQRIDKKERFADSFSKNKVPTQGNSSVLKASKGNYYQHRLGDGAAIRLIFGPKNQKAWREIGSN